MPDTTSNTQESYDRVASAYSKQISGELEHKPLERELLATFAQSVDGRLCDLGCGPGHVTAYLRDQGADAFGVDLSPGMIAQARAANPDIPYEVGDMRALNLDDGALGGIAALYSIIHITREEVTATLRELRRVLKPGGKLLVGFHKGTEVQHRDELWDQPVSLDFFFFEPGEMVQYLKEAGFAVDDVIERAPYPEVETQTHRVYVLAHKPG